VGAFVPYPGRRASVFNLGHIGELSENRTIPLFVSPQVLYLLQNVALVEIANPYRYALSLEESGYYRLEEQDGDEYATFLELVSQTGLQLSEYLAMSTPLNYKESLVVQTSTTNASAGNNVLSIQGPGSDEVWILDNISVWNANKNLAYIFIYISLGGGVCYLSTLANTLAGIPAYTKGPIHLSNDQALSANFIGCNAGDDLTLQATGYIMELIA